MNKKKLTLNNLKNKLNRSKKRIYNSYDLMNSIDYALLMDEQERQMIRFLYIILNGLAFEIRIRKI